MAFPAGAARDTCPPKAGSCQPVRLCAGPRDLLRCPRTNRPISEVLVADQSADRGETGQARGDAMPDDAAEGPRAQGGSPMDRATSGTPSSALETAREVEP